MTSRKNGSNYNGFCEFADEKGGVLTMTPTEVEKSEQRQLRDEKIAECNSDNIIESYDTNDGGRVDILYDSGNENPLEWVMSKIVANETTDKFQDSVKSDDTYSYAMSHGAIVAMPVIEDGPEYKLDRAINSEKPSIATIYVTAKEIHSGFGDKGATIKETIDALEGDLQTYSSWTKGEIYMACIYDKYGESRAIHGGYYNKEDIKSEWK